MYVQFVVIILDFSFINNFIFFRNLLDTDTDFSESEALSSLQISAGQMKSPPMSQPSQSEADEPG